VGQPGCSRRLPQPGQLTIGDNLLGYHNNNLVTVYIPRWFTRLQMVTHPSTNPAVQGRELNSQPVDYKYDTLTITPASHGEIKFIFYYCDYYLGIQYTCSDLGVFTENLKVG